ncbi:MAG: hypothetical protein ACJ8F7_05865 [Gemmataceae bacterium]
MLLFAAQGEPNVARVSHTFGAFVRLPDGDANRLELKVINWMPRTLQIEPLRMYPQAGTNLNLPASLQWAKSVDSKVTMWGPYEVRKPLYDMAVQQANKLSSGGLEYQLNDRRSRGQGAANCIHALSDLDVLQPPLETGTECGNDATLLVLTHFRKYIVPTDESMDWLTTRLNLSPTDMEFATSDEALARP